MEEINRQQLAAETIAAGLVRLKAQASMNDLPYLATLIDRALTEALEATAAGGK